MAYDMRLMMARMQIDGEVGSAGAVERMQQELGTSLRSYRDYALETADRWRAAQ
jgi:hypothetical protein